MYNAEDIYNIGVEVEKNGQAFYAEAAKVAKDEDSKKLLEELANWELGHVSLFDELKNELPSDVRSGEDLFDIDNDVAKYFKAAADSHVFKKGVDIKKMVNEINDTLGIFKMALRFEKDSVVLYQGMKNLVSESMGKNKVDKLIDEEMIHVSMMQERIAQLKSGK